MESKRTILNKILRIVSAEEARNQALTEEFRSMRKELADQWGEICCTVLQTEKTQKTLVAMLRELINEVKKINPTSTSKPVLCISNYPKHLTNDVIKKIRAREREIRARERDLFTQTKQHYDYTGEEKTIGQAKAVKSLLAEGYNLSDRPYLALHSLVRNLGITALPTKAKNAKSGNYRIYVKDLQKIRDYLR